MKRSVLGLILACGAAMAQTSYSCYDANGNLLKVVDQYGNNACPQVYSCNSTDPTGSTCSEAFPLAAFLAPTVPSWVQPTSSQLAWQPWSYYISFILPPSMLTADGQYAGAFEFTVYAQNNQKKWEQLGAPIAYWAQATSGTIVNAYPPVIPKGNPAAALPLQVRVDIKILWGPAPADGDAIQIQATPAQQSSFVPVQGN